MFITGMLGYIGVSNFTHTGRNVVNRFRHILQRDGVFVENTCGKAVDIFFVSFPQVYTVVVLHTISAYGLLDI